MDPHQWLNRAQQRCKAAEALLNQSILEDALFSAHQTIEVALKAVILAKTNKLPPKIHSLQQLAKISGYKHPGAFAPLEPIYISVRYPDTPPITITKKETQELINLAKEVLIWSQSQLK